MRTIRTKVYKFEELVVDAQQNAIEDYQSKQEIHLDFFNDSAKEQIIEAGFLDDVKLQYSLSYSQGDGLSFSCDRVEESILLSFFAEILGKNKEKTAKLIIENCSFENRGNKGSHYSYASTNDITFELENYGTNYNKSRIEDVVSQVEKKLAIKYFDLCKDLENQGYKDIEYQRSEENVREILIYDNYEFLSNGKQY